MLNFGRLKGEKTGFSVITFLQKIVTYSPERFSDSSPLSCCLMGIERDLRSNQGEVRLKLLCIPSWLSSFRQ